MIRHIPLVGSLIVTVVTTALFATGTISLATVGLIIAFMSLGVACYLSLFVETADHTQLGVFIFLTYATGMGLLTAPDVFGYSYIRPPARIMSGLLFGLLVAILWLFYVQVDDAHRRHRGT